VVMSISDVTQGEQRVLALRFVLEDGPCRSIAEVGLGFDVSRERIRKIETKALPKPTIQSGVES
jgi:DNA-directed RNA polymerase sigma subunit (sigma70/sigma32)